MAKGRFKIIRCGISGVDAVAADTAHAFGRHTHDQFGIGVILRGALYMAWAMFRDRAMLSLKDDAGGESVRQVILSAILINLLNPKLSIFFFAFLPQFVSVDDTAPVSRMLELSLALMALTLVIFAAYGAFAAAVRQHVISSASVQIWMRRGFAAAFAGLAAQLAFTQRCEGDTLPKQCSPKACI